MSYKPTAETMEVVKRLGGTWHGDYAMCKCPAHDDSKPSLSIKQGDTSILVHCFGNCDGASVMSAIRNVMGGSIVSHRAEKIQVTEKHDRHTPIWQDSKPIEGTLAERYLKEVRGIDFIPREVRFHPRCPQGKSPDTKFLPALIIGIFRDRSLVAVQRIFLDPATARYTAKMILGDLRGGVWPSTFSTDHMAVAEGFETACTFQQITDLEAGTCFGTANFSIFQPPTTIKRITFLPDNDEGGMTAVSKAIPIRQEQEFLTRTKLCPPNFGDWADILKPKGQTTKA